ncbi:hypothetical protein V6N12_069149 [Hibiscus sabdariffa]|uniref:Uncharacterized protein n=1 Tax=Hibiscus sabdariffa TaxID=183260 RepID=A0ABR2FD61_9ROSI
MESNVLETVLQAIVLPEKSELLQDIPIDIHKLQGASPEAEISNSKKNIGKNKSKKVILASTTKFNQIETRDARQPRAASMGVAALLQEIKTKKKDHIARHSEVPVVVGGGTKSISPQ